MGPQHPSTHGVLQLEVELDGEIVTDVIPHIGYLHRCFEKYAENKTYPQIIPYVDRMDYVCSMNNEWPYVLGMEKMLDIKVPEKVEYIRVIMAELNRIANHQIAIATFGLDSGAFTPFLYFFRDREMILTMFEKASGGRLLYNYFWVGGLAADVHPTFKEDVTEIVRIIRDTNAEILDLLLNNKIFVDRTANVGILPADIAISYGVTGPMLRASGVPLDLRRSEPYSIYDRFDFDIPTGRGEVGTVGDCWDRNIVRFREMEESCKIIEQALKTFPTEGDVREKVPKRIKLPKGEIYCRAENPKGELGFYIVSDGKDKPERVKARAPSFVNLGVLPEMSRGYMFSDLVMILGSVDIVLGEVDR
ncbi:MAG TPA: NADH-quinone oxidoreductase subunit D [Candidatus Kapabacteria bacterium]|nr:NADH-quinone oxidoreductase subunit D [Candidatus Kapabacteria bacterium]